MEEESRLPFIYHFIVIKKSSRKFSASLNNPKVPVTVTGLKGMIYIQRRSQRIYKRETNEKSLKN